MKCSYCAVPGVRGRSRSRSVKNIFKQVELLVENGYIEIVLGGINLGLYSETLDLPDLILELSKYDRLKHIRLSSIEPQLFTEKLLMVIGSIDKICPHFHIPLQSGSDYLLKRHGRNYDTKLFIDLIHKLQELKPDCAFSFDVIVGLPGETDEHFLHTYNFLKSIDLAYLHVFIYSKRPNTPATIMKDQVHGKITKYRSKQLLELSEQKKEMYISKLINNDYKLTAHIESATSNDMYTGMTDRGIMAYFSQPTKHNGQVRLIPKKLYKDGIYCECIV
jgi:threonylcarbamoyladenosine tRNA methylthiotransferase MtaB